MIFSFIRSSASLLNKSIISVCQGLLIVLALFLTACSSNDSSGIGFSSGPSDSEIMSRSGPTPEYLRPYRGGTNNPSYVVRGKSYNVLNTTRGYSEVGLASWYGDKFHGNPTSTGDRYDMYEFTAAHKSLPLPSFVRVTNLSNNRSLVVKVNDRGPFIENRIIDLSYAAATKLGTKSAGVVRVKVEALAPYQYRTQALADAAGAGSGSSLANSSPPVTTAASRPASSSGYQLAETLTIAEIEPVVTAPQPLVQQPSAISLSAVSVEPVAQPLVQPAAQPLLAQPLVQQSAQPLVAQQPITSPASGCIEGQKRCLQIGVFASRNNAEQAQAKVQQVISGRTEIQPTARGGQTLYRVLVGPMNFNDFESVSAAAHNAGVYGRFVSF